MKTIFVARLIVTASCLFSPLAAVAQANAQPQPAATAANAAPASKDTAATGEKKICKVLPSSTSHMTTRTCLTAKEWEQVEEEGR